MPDVFVIGDSISIQYGPFLERLLTPEIGYARKSGDEAAMVDLDVPRGANGGDSSMVRTYLEALAADGFSCGWLLLNCGLHDIKRAVDSDQCQIGLEAYRANLRAIFACAATIAQATIWIRSTPVIDAIHNASPKRSFHRYATDLAAYNAAADAIASEAGLRIIDLHQATASYGAEAFRDHAHFHEPIQQAQAAFIAGHLRAWGIASADERAR